MKPKFINGHPIRRISECRVRCEHCGRSFLSPAMYKSASTKIIVMSGTVFQSLRHFRNASTADVHLPRIPLWVHRYICCILSQTRPQHRHMLVVACPCSCRIVMVDKVFLIHLVIKFAVWTVVLYCACLNNLSSTPFKSSMWVRFLLSRYWSIQCLDILYAIDWERLEWTGNPQINTLVSP